jgi:hypothetical protein
MRFKMRLAAGLMLSAAILTGCSATPESLQSEPEVDSKTFAASYDVVFNRVLSAATACFTVHNSPGSYMVPSGELHRDRAYADFRLAAGSVGFENYFLSAKIEQSGSGSRVTTKANNPLIARGLSSMLMGWAGGGTICKPNWTAE